MSQKEIFKQSPPPAEQKISKEDAEHNKYQIKKAPGVQQDSEPVGGA